MLVARDLKDRGEKDTNAVIAVFEKAQKKDPEDAWGWIQLRRLYQEAGRLADARPAAEQALAQAKNERERSVALNELGEVLMSLGDLSGARSRYESSLKIAEGLVGSNPSSGEAQQDVSLSLYRLGDVLVMSGDLSGARSRYESTRRSLRPGGIEPEQCGGAPGRERELGKLGGVLVSRGPVGNAIALRVEPEDRCGPVSVEPEQRVGAAGRELELGSLVAC
jgi:tetratricopeptide (TPR) repeat protein